MVYIHLPNIAPKIANDLFKINKDLLNVFVKFAFYINEKLGRFGVTSPHHKTGSLPFVTSCHLSGGPPSLPLWGDVIFG